MTYNITNHLRFVERDVPVKSDTDPFACSSVKILQQFIQHSSGKDFYEDENVTIPGTWRDVRVVKE